jgi:broad specificity phosphatase PhoE
MTGNNMFFGGLRKRLNNNIVVDAPLTKCGLADAARASTAIGSDIRDKKHESSNVAFMASSLHRSQQTTMVIYKGLVGENRCKVQNNLEDIYQTLREVRETRCGKDNPFCNFVCPSSNIV